MRVNNSKRKIAITACWNMVKKRPGSAGCTIPTKMAANVSKRTQTIAGMESSRRFAFFTSTWRKMAPFNVHCSSTDGAPSTFVVARRFSSSFCFITA